MSDTLSFKGTIVRVERDGFGIIHFDAPLGANTHGVFSTVISSTLPLSALKEGVRVRGVAEVDAHELAAVKTILIDPMI